jgi:3-deoxy-D-manno-octulosonic-acid transferase
MPYSLGLTLYNLKARRDVAPVTVYPERPAGRLVWLNVPSAEGQNAMLELSRRIIGDDGHPVLITGPAGHPALPQGVIWQLPPPDTPVEAQAFLNHWQPEAVLLADGEVRPALLAEVLARKLPVAMVNARAPVFPRDRSGWWPGLMRGLLAQVNPVWALDAAAARAFRKAGSPAAHVVMAGRMEEGSVVLPAVETDRQALAGALGTRPVWLAADVPEAEETAVIDAHRAALRSAHRLLLILVPQDPARVPALIRRLSETENWVVASRADDEEPGADAEVYVVTGGAEYGLWYRLAPITYLAGSLSAMGCQRDPLEAAALGSAIIHGPRPGIYGATIGRLGAALAARPVASAHDLSEALGDLLSPDRAARLAHAAWDVASDGAEVTDRVAGLVRHMLGEDG